MEPQRRNLLAMAAGGCLLILAGIFSGSWISGSGEESEATTVMKLGLTSGNRCVSGQCSSIDPGSFDDNLGYIGMAVILAGLIAVGATIVAMLWIQRRQEIRIDPKKLALPVGAGAAGTVAFLFIGHQSAHLTPSWSGVVALIGFGGAAGAMFLAKNWLPNAPVGHAAPGWGQPQPGWPPQGGYAPPPQGGYAPPQQPVGYAPPQRPVQPIQPTMPAQGYGPPQGGYVPPSQPPMMPGGQPPTPMTPQPFAPARPAAASQPPVAMMSNTIPPGANPCPKCATGLAYSSQYGKWYCARCREYM